MLRDARELAPGAVLQADVCIVGAGAAGITVALELMGRGLEVILLESGAMELEEDTQALYEGAATGPADVGLTGCRARMLGGSTNWWAGWCRPLDAVDFEARDWLPRSGWPLTREALDPFYRRALRLCQAGALDYDAAAVAARVQQPLLPLETSRAANVLYQYSPPTNFGLTYLDALSGAEGVTTWLHANLVEIVLDEAGARVERLRCATLEGGAFEVEAGRVVLAMGGLETARSLLASNRQEPDGVGNLHGNVGRFFMEHPHLYKGAWMVLQDVQMEGYLRRRVAPTIDEDAPEGIDARVTWALGVDQEIRRQEGLLGWAATIRQLAPEDAAEATGPLSSQQVAHLLDPATPFGLYYLDIRAEQRPLADSRLTLSSRTDALGLPTLSLDWRVSDEDLANLKRSLELVGVELGRLGLGRLWIPTDDAGRYTPPIFRGGCHHLGTARMSVAPADGVVDSDCRVHGLDNLFIASSAVFPTGGFANPTLTIVALALRLAGHLLEQQP